MKTIFINETYVINKDRQSKIGKIYKSPYNLDSQYKIDNTMTHVHFLLKYIEGIHICNKALYYNYISFETVIIKKKKRN